MKSRNVLKGFTLVELMIVVVIVAILAAIAYPAYTSQVRKAARKEAVGVVLKVAGLLERRRSQLFIYPTSDGDLAPFAQNTKRYGITVGSVSSGEGFIITAAPAGDQQKDPCGTITYDQAGVWKFTLNTTTVPESDCL